MPRGKEFKKKLREASKIVKCPALEFPFGMNKKMHVFHVSQDN